MKTYSVYILKCSDGSYYTGITNNLERRLYEHVNGLIKSCYTQDKRPVKLMYYEEFNDVKIAISREKQIKNWSRKKKEALIIGDLKLLSVLSRANSITPRQARGDN